MNIPTDQQLLSDYAKNRSEAAFAELVRRKIDLVHSAALRMVRDVHLAEDVTQAVFMALAQNARQLSHYAVVSGWLHRTAQNLAAKVVRSDVRRRTREQEVIGMNELLSDESPSHWDDIAPQLDVALGELSAADRDVLLLRYFEHKSAREMALTLGVTDEAAQKRASRAIERLREIFAKRGISVGASGLIIAISANAVQSAPAGLVAAISTAAALSTTATHAITMITLQKTLMATALVVAVGAGIYEAQRAAFFRDNVQALQQEQGSLADKIQQLNSQYAAATNAQALSRDQLGELLRLRAEHRDLESRIKELGSLREENRRLRSGPVHTQNSDTANQPQPTARRIVPKESWAFVGFTTPENAFQSATWAMNKGDLKTLLDSMTPELQQKTAKEWEGRSEAQIAEENINGMTNVTGFTVIGKIAVSDDEVNLLIHTEGEDLTPTFIMKRIDNEWKISNRVKYTPF